MDFKAVDVKIAEALKLADTLKAADTIKLADSVDVKAAATFGGQHVTVNVTNILLPQLPAVVEAEYVKQLPALTIETPGSEIAAEPAALSVVLSRVMGVVVAKDLEGSRVHLEFVVVNQEDRPHVLRWAALNIGDGRLHPKQFFAVTAADLRIPQPAVRFPLVIAPKNALRVAVEFENLYRPLLSAGLHEVELVLEQDGATIVTQRFTCRIIDDTAATLRHLKSVVNQDGGAVVFDLPIEDPGVGSLGDGG
jgi:hypothetical protein